MALRIQDRQVECLEGWLRSRLLVTDGDGSVLIGPVPNPFRKEVMPRYLVQELKDPQVPDPPTADLFDKAPPIPGEPMVLYRASCHPRISSRVV
jgi:hypothetical protein